MNFKKIVSTLSATTLASLALLGSAPVQAQDNTILIYSNSLSDERQEWILEQSESEGFNLEFVAGGGGDILNRLLAEKNAPQADVTFGMDESSFMQLEDEEMLVEFEPSWVDELLPEAVIGEGYYYPLVEQRIFMIYNAEFVEGDDVPTNWQDLAANPNLEGKFRVPNELGGGTNQKAVMSILLQYIDPEGELGISQEGWDEVEAYLTKGYMTPEGEDFNQNFADGTVPISYYSTSVIPGAEETYGYTATPVNPEQGVITMREQIGILDKGDDHDYTEAERFVEWFGSSQVQADWAVRFGSHPLNEVAYESTIDRVKEIVDATTPMDIDWNFVRENLSSWIEKIELELMPL
ncbi:extracellular solute-binding protein [Fundicoccus sp. Sow4_H7]|uniref:extracellular solute-binding protein n=1 Tax=Fundicoccus sp. Sow4_H7 TaxID=3438784 RepID=UPI003F926D10